MNAEIHCFVLIQKNICMQKNKALFFRESLSARIQLRISTLYSMYEIIASVKEKIRLRLRIINYRILSIR